MLCVTLRVETPLQGWCRAASLKRPQISVHVLSCFPLASGSMQETVELSGPRWQETLEDVRTHADIRRVDVLNETTDGATVRLEVQGCPFPRMFSETGVVPTFPFDVHNGSEEWMIVAREGETSALLSRLDRQGIRTSIVRSGPYRPHEALTERQREVLGRAVAEGYYAFPRRITLTRLAEKLGIAKSTLSEMLMVVERQLMARPLRGVRSGPAVGTRRPETPTSDPGGHAPEGTA